MKIALIGYGKMGKAIEEVAIKRGHTIVLKINIENAIDLTIPNLQQADVAIEFTGPETAPINLKACFDAGLPVVCGSTGWLHQWERIIHYCTEKKGALVYASNFSIGVNLFFELNVYLAEIMNKYENYDVTIKEVHHTQKIDSPSGTAITLAQQILKNVHRKSQWVNEKSLVKNNLVIESERKDPAPGTHHVKYTSDVDDIEIIHTAHNRSGFANGAVMAAEFIEGKKGIFSMKEVLGL